MTGAQELIGRRSGRRRIAVVMSGHLRSLRTLTSQHRTLLTRLGRDDDVELFVHAWKTDEGAGSIDEGALAELAPMAVRLDSPVEIPPAHVLPPGVAGMVRDRDAARRLASMWLGIERGFDLVIQRERELHTRFDIVVRTRPDLLWDIEAEVSAGGERARFPRRHAALIQPSDLAFVVPREQADPVFRFYSRLPALIRGYGRYGYRAIVPEYVLGYHLASIGVEWRAFDQDVVLVRESGAVLWFDHDADSLAFKSGKGICAELGDGLPYAGADVLGPVQRTRCDVLLNAHPRSDVDYEVGARAWEVEETVRMSGSAGVALVLGLLSRRCTGLIRIYLVSALLDALRKDRRALRELFVRPSRSLRACVTLAGFLGRRYRRRRRSARRLGIRVSRRSLLRSHVS